MNSNAQNTIKSYIIQLENGKVYLDATSPKVKVGDVLSVYTDAGYMIHPISKQQIKKEGEILADLEIVEVKKEYSIATIYPESAQSKLKAGMVAEMPEIVDVVKGDVEVYDSVDEMGLVPTVPIFYTAEDVIKWHEKCTGFDKLIKNNLTGQLVEKEIISTNKKGKINSRFHFTNISKIEMEKLYLKFELTIHNNTLLSSTIVINGKDGWEKKRKKAKTMSDKNRLKIMNSAIGAVDSYLNSYYTKQLIGSQYVDGKECVGIRISNVKTGENYRNFYDISNGLLVASYVSSKGQDEVLIKVIEYRNFDGIMQPCITESTDEKGRVTTEKTIRWIPNYSLDNIMFTEEDTYRTF